MTDIELYDRAIFKYLSDISSKVVYATTNKAAQTILKSPEYSDNIPYNFISFYREPDFSMDDSKSHFTAERYGDMVRLQQEGTRRDVRYVHNFPVNLTYQIDIWSAKETAVQETSIALMQKLKFSEPILIVDGINPDGEEGRFHFEEITWVDNSDLEAENEKGKLYRHTIKVTVTARIKLTRDVPTTQFCAIPVDIYNND